MDQIRTFRNTHARADVHIWQEGHATVSDVLTNAPGQGHGTAIMQTVCDWADRNGLVLVLGARRYHYGEGIGLDNKQLVKFYEKFGFVHVGELFGRPFMQREPLA